MSVTHPLIREIKGHVQKLVNLSYRPLTDDDEELTKFCECLERILYKGLTATKTSFGFIRDSEYWFWLKELGSEQLGATYTYELCVQNTNKCGKVVTNRGRGRLLIRNALVKRCLHIPFELFIKRKQSYLYSVNSILGDEILSQLLLSAVLICARLEFKLDLNNARFLDDTWLLPKSQSFLLVPCSKLGISVIFVSGKTVVVEVSPFSVASENANIQVGDILDDLNGHVITEHQQGNLIRLLKKSSKLPVSIYIVKADWKDNIFPPIVPLLRQVGLDPIEILAKRSPQSDPDINMSDTIIKYLGEIDMKDGSTKDIHKVINTFVQGSKCSNILVMFECIDMGVKVSRMDNSEEILRCPYLKILACGRTSVLSSYFGFITKEGQENGIANLKCHTFYCSSATVVSMLLNSIGRLTAFNPTSATTY